MSQYIQVASLRSANKHTPNPKKICTKGCEFCANPLAKSSHPPFCGGILLLIGLRHFAYCFFAYLSDILAIIQALKLIVQQ